jgi:hypothetical protein
MKLTFSKLLQESKIEIPIIQRDYAQGRLGDRIEDIRVRFVNDLKESLKNGVKLHLDFVYGKKYNEEKKIEQERKKENLTQLLETVKGYSTKLNIDFDFQLIDTTVLESEDSVLIPLDGQQRLTTLFLLHYYIGSLNESDINFLKKFTYLTRKSSKEFCKIIIENPIKISDIENSVSEFIINQNWFYSEWKHNPTVAGMLVMLDAIHEAFKTELEHLQSIWHNLVYKDDICFDFFDLNEYNLEDELYVKMNARGKPLSDFENFKAWLYESPQELAFQKDWNYKIDKNWLDIFWNIDDKFEEVDNRFLNFFKHLALYIQLEKIDLENSIEKEVLLKQMETLINNLSEKSFVSNKFYKINEVFNESSLTFIFTILNNIQDDGLNILINILNKYWTDTFCKTKFEIALLSDFRNLNLFDKAYLFAILKYISKSGKLVKDYTHEETVKFEQWLRISRNLIYNSRIDDKEPFYRALKAISALDLHILDVEYYIKSISESSSDSWVKFFPKVQQKEEWYKINVLDKAWSEKLEIAENHFYFYGQVQFISELCKDNSGLIKIESFDSYFAKLSNLFTTDNLDDNDFIIQRSLLIISDTWMPDYGSDRYAFCLSKRSNARERDENWRRVFNNPDYRKELKKLLDNSDCKTDSLQKEIDTKQSDISDWRRLIFDNPKIINYCSQGLIKWELDGNYIQLLSQSKLSHYHCELRSYAFYIANKEKYKDAINYCSVTRSSETPHITYKTDKENIRIKFNEKKLIFEYSNNEIEEEKITYKAIDPQCTLQKELNSFKTFCVLVTQPK